MATRGRNSLQSSQPSLKLSVPPRKKFSPALSPNNTNKLSFRNKLSASAFPRTMASTATYSNTAGGAAYSPASSDDERAAGGRKSLATQNNFNNSSLPQLPTSDGLRAPAGGLLRGALNEDGTMKNAGLMVGIKLDLEAEVHLTARIRGDIVVGLY